MLLLAALISVNAQAVSPAHSAGNSVPPHLSMSVNIPDALQQQIARQDFENEAIFSFKNGKDASFLFSVTKVSSDQWLQLKDQLKNYTVIENSGDYITFVQKTDVKKLKGSADAQYQQVMLQLDGIISTIHLN